MKKFPKADERLDPHLTITCLQHHIRQRQETINRCIPMLQAAFESQDTEMFMSWLNELNEGNNAQ